ncbi:hypothetical protein [Micromonospora sp. NPDC050495]|uniref:hypothetical protein n=1 Tax=Micromonospora sp. NPDC050495 TaxID=3154936 RepID=UPI0033EE2B02
MSLAHHYRRLLLAYPRPYRRERGEELLGLLLDTNPPGRTRPTVAAALNLLRNGLRCRLGRPASRTVVAWAALTALICGLFTAALAARAAWETSRPQPDRAEAAAALATTLPGHRATRIDSATALFEVGGEPVGVRGLPWLLVRGRAYQEGSTVVSATNRPLTTPAQVLDTARQRLVDAGWQVSPTAHRTGGIGARGGPDVELTATRGDTALRLVLPTGAAGSFLTLELRRTTPPAVLPAAVVAGLAGALTGWFVFGWASRRGQSRREVTLLYWITMWLWAGPALAAAPVLLLHQVRLPHPQWHPLWEWLGLPTASPLFLLGLIAASAALTRAARPGPQPEPLPRPAAA